MSQFLHHLGIAKALILSLVICACSEPPDMPNVGDAERMNDTRMQARDGSPSSNADANQPNPMDHGVGELDAALSDLGRPADAGTSTDMSTGDGGQWMDADIMQPQPDANIPIPEPPTFDYIDRVIDLAVPNHNVWAHLIYVDRGAFEPRFVETSYRATGAAVDFWPASTIKMFTATAALEILNALNMSIDATATFYRLTDGQWIEDITLSFRELIHRTFNCSSNETYTLLLRLAGIDWLNTEFFVPEKGFERTALMRGYVSANARPFVYLRTESQRIAIREGNQEVIREHTWSGRSYADETGCTIYNDTGTGNCTTPRDMAEHLRRLVLHEELPPAERFQLGEDALAWYRGSGPEKVLNNTAGDDCGGPAYAGVRKVFDDPVYHHKGGTVREYRGTIQHIQDPNSGTQYTAGIAVETGDRRPIEKASEELARMLKTPGIYVHLDSLRDYVNPIRANLVVISDEPGTLQLVTKPYDQDGFNLAGWSPLQGATAEIASGQNEYNLRSVCLNRSEQVHIRGQVTTVSGRIAWSDLHYVIVDHTQACQ